MNLDTLHAALDSLPLGGMRYFDAIDSTNNAALTWAAQGAPDRSLVIADEQTAGRGRANRKWVTPRGTALALSLILRPTLGEAEMPSLFTGLAALALVDTLKKFNLQAQVKWPNDVLLDRKKCAGILVESSWVGSALEAVVIGVGVNVGHAAVPPAGELLFPATSVEDAHGHPVERVELLRDLLASMLDWRQRFGGNLVHAWEAALAFRDEPVWVGDGSGSPLQGRIAGLESDGSLRLRVSDKIVTVHFGEMHLRPTL